MGKLDGKTIIITGAGSGIGSAIASRCLQDGAFVLGCDLDLTGLQKLQEKMQSRKLSVFQVDVTSYREVDAFFKQIAEELPQTDSLVNNAGIYFGQNILDYTAEQIDRVISVNIKGAVYFSQLFGKYFLDKSVPKVIVNISSVSGHEGSSDAVYGLSKAAMLGLTKSCAMNFAPHIRVNAVAPGLVETNMIRNIPEWRLQEFREKELIKTPILPEDVANTVAFLLSDESRNYTGSVFDMNNGCYLR